MLRGDIRLGRKGAITMFEEEEDEEEEE